MRVFTKENFQQVKVLKGYTSTIFLYNSKKIFMKFGLYIVVVPSFAEFLHCYKSSGRMS